MKPKFTLLVLTEVEALHNFLGTTEEDSPEKSKKPKTKPKQ